MLAFRALAGITRRTVDLAVDPFGYFFDIAGDIVARRC